MVNYQEDYSSLQPLMFNEESRTNKARKTVAVLKDYFGKIDDKIVLEIGCSTGIITNYFADYFSKIDGIVNEMEDASIKLIDVLVNNKSEKSSKKKK